MSWHEYSVQVTVQDAGKAGGLQQAVKVPKLGLDGLREHAFGDRVQHTVHDVDDDVLEGCIALQDVGATDRNRPSVVVDLDEDVVAARGGDLQVAAKAAAGHRVTDHVMQHELPQEPAVRLEHLDDARRQRGERQVVGGDYGQRRERQQDVLDLRQP